MGSFPHYFIAIPLSSKLQDYFSNWQDELVGKLPYKQWYNKKDFHITLKFLGEVDDNKLKALRMELEKLSLLKAFSIVVGEIGTFGNPKSPRVIWAGVEKNKNLMQLAEKVEEYATKVGFPKENRPYSPHITLAKKWIGEKGKNDINWLEEAKEKYKETNLLRVQQVNLYQIHPGKEQKYEPVQTIQLR
ncbi:RNA 2',3'-cyclic phosphodiesterase [Oceanobacillus piezotolerans]|uniref:RNA 2',3'-cyclic phosphodiesterase n=1 Tax=Oceanobacillus piezotolerans TaxID=2448030 RepID=A0A498DDX8_9BACI|nr:RNA 2',3'-cyclic phosphodiesterase [Oceanobacillus piezotolerans]RLL47715.1 RNA 2',3'-cyclic phosphodiesterase [Oceanobacillus piezotolerans]